MANETTKMDSSKDEAYHYPERVIEPMEHRKFRIGQGKISASLACSLGVLSLLAVLCFKFPTYLTTAELRAAYDLEFLRTMLKWGIAGALAFGMLTFMIGKFRRLAAIGVLCCIGALMLGGHEVEARPVTDTPFAFGLDWLVLAFVFSAILFMFLEKVLPKYKDQAVLRPEWKLDLFYFGFNHLMITALLLTGNYFVANVFGWAVSDGFQSWIQNTPIWAQVIILLLCADFVLYWSHRTFHEHKALWKIHAVHHSVEHMDWMAGSRNHVIQMFVDRCLAMVPLYLLGASKEALDIYVGIAAFQAVYVHSNVHIPVGPLRYIFCTPQYHHWHHSSETPAIDTNYAVHLPLYDMIFGTYHMPGKLWPAHYGTVTRLPRTFLSQLVYPFKKDT